MNALGRALVLLALASAAPAPGREWRVGPGRALPTPQAALALAAEGDVVRVAPGTYRGPLAVRRGVHLLGEGRPTLDGGGHGTVVTLAAPGATLAGFRVRGSGSSLEHEDAGVLVSAPRAVVRDNLLEDVLFGISVQEAPGSRLLANRIAGKPLDLARRGDAIRVWRSDDTRVEDNLVRGARDVVLWYSQRLTVRGNQVRDSRYGLHFMYCDDAEITHNVLRDNSVGAFLMYSRRLRFMANAVAGNHGPSGYGIGLKDMDDFTVAGNRFLANRVGVFIDGAPTGGALLAGNLLGAGEVGVRLLPNVRGLRASDNSFLENQQQVEIAGGGGDADANRWQGNHWSDYGGFDADGDGVGDVPYRADRLFEELLDRAPALRFFAFSPLVRTVDFASRAFPLVRPQPKLTDLAPRLAPRLPAGTPALATGGASNAASSTRRLASGLLLAALAVLAVPRWLLGGRRVAPPTLTRGATMQEPPLLAVRGVGKRYGDHDALADLSFDVHAGEAVALWGANGAGKTTALRALLGVIPCSGEVRVGGLDVRRQGRRARRLLGFVPQEIAFPDLSAGEALELFASLHGVPRTRIAEVAERMGLAGELDKRVHALSGGRKQRLALAVALLADPPLLLLDEASSNLDAAARRELLHLLAELKAEGKTLVFSSHRPEEVARLADRVLHLEHGRLVADLPPATLLAAELAEVNERLRAEGAVRGSTSAAGEVSSALPWIAATLPAALGGAVHTHDFGAEDPS